MKEYDFEKMKQLVKDNTANGLNFMFTGMAEDWSWTYGEVWSKKNGFSKIFENEKVQGIGGSAWATPVVQMRFEDGTVITEDCYVEKQGFATKKEIELMKGYAKKTFGLDKVNKN